MKRRGFVATLLAWLAVPQAVSITQPHAIGKTTERERLIARVMAIRAAGSAQDGPWILRSPVEIGGEDYLLMGADNSCGRIRAEAQGLNAEAAVDQQWYRISPKWVEAPQFWNAHATQIDGRWVTEVALLQTVAPAFRVSPEEVVWHHMRRAELVARGVQQDDRVRLMTTERQSAPWEQR